LVSVVSCSGSSGTNLLYTYGGANDWSGGTNVDIGGLVAGIQYQIPSVPAPTTIVLNNLSNTCAKRIYSQLIKSAYIKASTDQTGMMDEVLQLLNDVADFDFVAYDADLGNPEVSAETQRERFVNTSGNSQISITFNSQYLAEASKLSIARTILHESVHAFLVYNGFCAPNGDVFQGYQNYLFSKGISQGAVGQHEFMAQYVNAIAYSLYQWDLKFGLGNIPLSYMKDIAWGGLTGYRDDNGQYVRYDSFINYTNNSSSVINRIESNVVNEKKANSYAKSPKCN
jgi:hypothetical protein